MYNVAVLRCHARAGGEECRGGEGKGILSSFRLMGFSRELTQYVKGCWEVVSLVLWQRCAGAQLQNVSLQGASQPCHCGLHQHMRGSVECMLLKAGLQPLRIQRMGMLPWDYTGALTHQTLAVQALCCTDTWRADACKDLKAAHFLVLGRTTRKLKVYLNYKQHALEELQNSGSQTAGARMV